jgi:hypothetical protein
VIERATAALHALACSDIKALDGLCHDDVLIWGTDEDEAWHGKEALLRAFRGTYDLSVCWLGKPASGAGWVAGVVEFRQQGRDPVYSRVTMVFTGELLAHAHYSVALPSATTSARVP